MDPYDEKPYRPATGAEEMTLLADNDLEAMANSFNTQPAITKAIETAGAVQNMTDDSYLQAVQHLMRSILVAGPLQAPHDVTEIWRMRLRPSRPGDLQQRLA